MVTGVAGATAGGATGARPGASASALMGEGLMGETVGTGGVVLIAAAAVVIVRSPRVAGDASGEGLAEEVRCRQRRQTGR